MKTLSRAAIPQKMYSEGSGVRDDLQGPPLVQVFVSGDIVTVALSHLTTDTAQPAQPAASSHWSLNLPFFALFESEIHP